MKVETSVVKKLPATIFREETILSIGIGVFGICLFLYAFVGLHNRYIADDYDFACMVNHYGFWHSQAVFYTGWSGRFSFMFVNNLFQLIGFNVARLLPPITIGIWLLAIFSLITTAHKFYYPGKDSKLCIFVSCATLYTLIYAAPNPFQTFYWETGILTYAVPMLIMLLFLRMVLQASVIDCKNSVLENVASFSLLLIAGGFSETNLIIQLILVAVLLAYFRFATQRRSRVLRLLGSGFLGSLVSLAIVVSAPGNQVRRAFFPAPLTILEIVRRTFVEGFAFAGATLLTSKSIIVFFLITVWAFLYANRGQHQNVSKIRRDLVIAAAIAGLSLLGSFGASFYSMTMLPPLRTLFVPKAAIVAALLLSSYFVAATMYNSRSWAVLSSDRFRIVSGLSVLTLLAAGPVRTAVQLGRTLPEWREYARQWDLRQEYMSEESSNRAKSVVIRSLHHPADLEQLAATAVAIQGDIELGENKCLAQLYGFEQVSVVR